MSLLEEWLNTFGGNDDLKPKTPQQTKAGTWRENARGPSNKPKVPDSTKPPETKQTRISARTVPPNAGSGPKYNTTPQNVGSGARVNTPNVPETTGKRVTVPGGKKPPVSLRPIFNTPNLKPVLGGAGLAAEAIFHSESLNVDEFGGEAGKKWLSENKPEGWTNNTMTVEAEITSKESIESQGNREAVALAEEKLKLLTESGASQSLIDEATASLNTAKSAGSVDQIKAFEDNTKEELASVQARIDAVLQETSSNPELAKLRLANEGLLERKAELTADLEDSGRIRDQRTADAIKDKAQGDPEADAVINAAGKVDIGDLTRQLMLKGMGEKDFKDLTDNTLKGWLDGIPLKEMMSGAADFLGELWDDKAIQNALVYYMGARLMGYSGSGSGMAAGQVLIKGWDNKAKSDLVTGTAKAKADAKKLDDATVDETKTVRMWDKTSKSVIEGYASKDGKAFHQVTADGTRVKPVNPAAAGLVTYSSGIHKTWDEIDKGLLELTNKTQSSFLTTLNSNDGYDKEDLYALNQNFADGRASRELLQVMTREMKEAGVDYDNMAFTTAFQNLLLGSMEKQAKGLRKGTHGEEMASMIGEWRESQLKNDLTGEGSIPKFIYGKALDSQWDKDGVVKYEKGFDASGHAKGVLENKIGSVKNYWIQTAIENGTSKQRANEFITNTRVVQELGRLFQDTVMQSPNARRYWTDQAGDDSNAFMAWMQSNDISTINTEHQYLGLNSPEVRKLGTNIEFHKPFIKTKKKS